MSVYIAFSVLIVIFTFVSVLLYRFSKNKSNKLMKYIPSIVTALSIALVYVKMLFLSQGYEPITDIVVIIILSFVLGFSLLAAVFIDIMNRRKRISK
ncbi:hypothetical protein A8F94_22605 [Bacillus sp. FJAT-27225]|uniref:hypothetical protein n=1 Tax=Bacillus sp. FJAT-27225 TaxID=1743144 RepID=UPI00080C3347|nr:hypothetical protein [Bacillus sp. FJAT-27225]OCA81656.1 hypothetical protein A8F94_22605 [Bacillus sp. FJAT-27225]